MNKGIIVLRDYNAFYSLFYFNVEKAIVKRQDEIEHNFIERIKRFFRVTTAENPYTAGFIRVMEQREMIAFYAYEGELHLNCCKKHFLLKDIQSMECLQNEKYLVKMKIVLRAGNPIVISEKISVRQFGFGFTPYPNDEDLSLLRLINNIYKSEERQKRFLNFQTQSPYTQWEVKKLKNKEMIILRDYDAFSSLFYFNVRNATAKRIEVKKGSLNEFKSLSNAPVDENNLCDNGFIKVSEIGEIIAFYAFEGELHLNYCEKHFLLKDIQSIERLQDARYLVKMKIVLNNGDVIIISEKIVLEQFKCDPTPCIEDEDFSILRFVDNIYKSEERQKLFLKVNHSC